MDAAILIGGVAFWLAVSVALALLLFVYAVGLARALSLHKMLARLRYAVDGNLCPFRTWLIWPREFLSDAYRLAGWPGERHGISYHFYGGPVIAHWHGIGDWKVGKRATAGERDE